MIAGVGIDIVDVPRIDALLEKYAERFQQRVFTQDEILYCRARSNPGLHFAARFAAKEAAVKALGTGIGQGIRFRDIEIVSAGCSKDPLPQQSSGVCRRYRRLCGPCEHLARASHRGCRCHPGKE